MNLTIYLVNMLAIYRIKNCYDTHNVILVDVRKKVNEDEKISELAFMNLKKVFSSNSFVEDVSICNSAIPYNYNLSTSEYVHDSDHFTLARRQVDIDYARVMKVTPLKGRWFNETDIGKAVLPAIVSKDIDEKYFNGNSIGQRFSKDKKFYEIVGVVERFKRSDIEAPVPFAFFLNEKAEPQKHWGGTFLIRTRENKGGEMLAVAEEQVYSTLNQDNWIISSLNSLDNRHVKQNAENYQRNYLTMFLLYLL